MIKTKSIYDHKEDSDGTRILITVGDPPNWLDHDDWKKELGPDWNTLMKWKYSKKTEQDWKIYEERLLAQIKGQPAREAIAELRQRSSSGETITLLCHCGKGQHCHRYIIKSLIENQR
jgi:uncharacterized protein YeaO (DUF488 family)